jgi:hemolysin activation/secretion protein
VYSVDASHLPGAESPCFRIDQLQINVAAVPHASSQELSGSRLDWLSAALSGPQGDDSPLRKCLGANGIGLVLKRAQDALLQRGWAMSAFSASCLVS